MIDLRLARVGAVSLLLMVGGARLVWSQIESCPPLPNAGVAGAWQTLSNDDLTLSIESGSGAVGDVVGLTVLMRSRIPNPNGIHMWLSLCHDPSVAEIVGQPLYSDELLSLLGIVGAQFFLVNDSVDDVETRGDGQYVQIDIDDTAYSERLQLETPIEVMTVYYRLIGEPGATGVVNFCDGILERGNNPCIYNTVRNFTPASPLLGRQHLAGIKEDATLTVIDGPATQPTRPPAPPIAKIYPSLPPRDDVNFRVRIEAAVAWPEATEIPVRVYVSADVEYSGGMVPIDFDERYLRLTHAEDEFFTGVVLQDNNNRYEGAGTNEGHAVVFNGFGVNSYRLAAEGEEILAATLYFEVLEAAAQVESTQLTVKPVSDTRGTEYTPWIGVRHVGINGDTRTEVAPSSIKNAAVVIHDQPLLFTRGDCNGDGQDGVDVSDAVFLLNFNFGRGAQPSCLAACDVNGDGDVVGQVADAIAMLNFSFAAGKPPRAPFPHCGPATLASDISLGCASSPTICP